MVRLYLIQLMTKLKIVSIWLRMLLQNLLSKTLVTLYVFELICWYTEQEHSWWKKKNISL